MTTVHHHFDRPVTEVFDALVDPRTYPDWLVGAKEVRSVDDTWPAPGSSFRHRVGLFGPLTVADRSTSRELDAPHLFVLEVRARPLGRARVTFRLDAPSPSTTEVEFSEEPIGPARVLSPVVAPLVAGRNVRSLQHLDHLLRERSG